MLSLLVEEIEIGRAVGERLIDTQASAEMARRLVALQRQRLTQTQVLDQRTRRTLHDDVLPRLHTALLALSAVDADQAREAVGTLTDVHRGIANLLRDLPTGLAPEVARLGLVGALRETIDGELAGAFDSVTWRVEPEAERAEQTISGLAAEVMFCAAREAMRNAARHARGGDAGRPLQLAVAVKCLGDLRVTVEDDGVGARETRSAAEEGGQGLVLHSTLIALLGGALTIESFPGSGARVSLVLPQEMVANSGDEVGP